MVGIPPARDTDAEDVAWALQTAEAQWKRNEHTDALVWLRRAIQGAADANDDARSLELARCASAIVESLRGPGSGLLVGRDSIISLDEADIEVFSSEPPPPIQTPPIGGAGYLAREALSEPTIPRAKAVDPSVPLPRAGPILSTGVPGLSSPKPPAGPAGVPRPAPRLPNSMPTRPALRAVRVRTETPIEFRAVYGTERSPGDAPLRTKRPTDEGDDSRPTPLPSDSAPTLPPPRPKGSPAAPLPARRAPPSPPVPPAPLVPAAPLPIVYAEPHPADGEGETRASKWVAEIPSAKTLVLEDVEAFADLPEDSREPFARAAILVALTSGEEVMSFALAYIVEGEVEVDAADVDVRAAKLSAGHVLRARGTPDRTIPLRLVCASPRALVAVWNDRAVSEAFRTCPWVEDDLRAAADPVLARAGVTLGPLGSHLDSDLRGLVTARLALRSLLEGEVLVEEGAPVPGIVVVAVGSIDLVDKGGGIRSTKPGDILFAAQLLGGGITPQKARGGPGGSLVLFGDRRIAQELLVTFPPLLEILGGM